MYICLTKKKEKEKNMNKYKVTITEDNLKYDYLVAGDNMMEAEDNAIAEFEEAGNEFRPHKCWIESVLVE